MYNHFSVQKMTVKCVFKPTTTWFFAYIYLNDNVFSGLHIITFHSIIYVFIKKHTKKTTLTFCKISSYH